MKTALLRTLLAIALIGAPLVAAASVQMTEVMYDAPGTDSGHEWIEITTDAPINLAGYRFAEGGTNHVLTTAQGTSSLVAGQIAIISNNPQTFLADFPNYTGTIFKSSFSLSNTGETVSIRDNKLADVATLTYGSSAGASGDGNSLHLNVGTWAPGAPNPGSLAPTKAMVKPAAAAKVTATKKTSAIKSTSKSSMFNDANASQSAAVANVEMPMSSPAPENNLMWTLFGITALIVLGIGGAVYARTMTAGLQKQNEELTADEFEIVG